MRRFRLERYIRSIAVILLSLAAPAVWADVRSDVNTIAQLVEKKYFDAAQAKTIAAELRKKASAGNFDALTDPDELAQELTRTLRRHDGHFHVAHEVERPALKEQRTAPRLSYEVSARRANYGYRRVERLPGNIGFIEMSQVAEIDFANANDPARRAADAALALVQGADAVILDLRSNGGGAPSMVGYFVSAFVKPDANVYNVFHSREGTESERPEKTYPQPNLDVPLFVLTSARTGSAAEAIAFTLQSCGRAQVVGERSAGAANPGESFRAGDYSVFIATGSPRNPINGRNWEGDGVRPDVEVAAMNALDRASIAALERVLRNAELSAPQKLEAQWVSEALRTRTQPFKPKRLADFTGTYGQIAIAVSGDTLSSTVGRRPPATLVPLRDDVFFDAQDPTRRFQFERTGGKVIAVRVINASGAEQRLRRSE